MKSSNDKINKSEKILKLIISTKRKENVKKALFSDYKTEEEKRTNLFLKLLLNQSNKQILKKSYIKRVIERFKNEKGVLIELSNYFLDKNIDIACESLRKYLEIEKENIDVNVFNNLGVLEERKGNEIEAIKFYIKAIEKDSEFVLAYYNKAHLYIKIKNYEDAVIDLNKALKVNKRKSLLEKEVYEKTLILLGEVYCIRKNYLDIVLLSEELYKLNKEKDSFEINQQSYNMILEEIKKEKTSEAENHLNIKFLKLIEKNIEKIINLK